ncbi:hypothetical protein ACUIAK_08880 [Bacillus cytotoxicus]
MNTTVAVPRAIIWKGDSITILNQTKLPHVAEYKTLTSIEDVWKSIVMLEVRGAPAIGIAGRFWISFSRSKI